MTVAICAGDDAECGRGVNGQTGVAPGWVVEAIEGFHAELPCELLLQFEVLEDGEVHVELRGAAQVW